MTDGGMISLFLDVIMLALLVAVIIFAGRLSLHLRDFRASRRDLDRIIKELSANVDRAENAMAGLREAARESGRDLQSMINQASSLSEELQFMNEAGNNMARRLETVAEKSGRTAAPQRAEAGFAIRDPEFGLDEDPIPEDDFFEEETAGLQSRAERELFEALQGAQGKKKARV